MILRSVWRFLAGTVVCFAGQGCEIGRPERPTITKDWFESNGVVDIFRNNALAARFVDVYKLVGTASYGPCREGPCAYGFGVLDINQNYKTDPGERERFFAVGDYGDRYVFYANPVGVGGNLLLADGA